VHIIYVPLSVATEGVSGGQVSTVALQAVKSHVGTANPHDIIVFAGQPFHFANDHELHAHPGVHHYHPETLLTLHRKRGERALWWSERSFAITQIVPEAPKKADKAEAPFLTPKTEPSRGIAGESIYVARSAVPAATADDQEYKITFTIEGEPQPVDPNMYCDPAP
jgi:hypothetical protein